MSIFYYDGHRLNLPTDSCHSNIDKDRVKNLGIIGSIIVEENILSKTEDCNSRYLKMFYSQYLKLIPSFFIICIQDSNVVSLPRSTQMIFCKVKQNGEILVHSKFFVSVPTVLESGNFYYKFQNCQFHV